MSWQAWTGERGVSWWLTGLKHNIVTAAPLLQRSNASKEDQTLLANDEPQLRTVPLNPRSRRVLWVIGFLALVIRTVLLPIDHWWDITVFYNTFIDLAHNHSPYDTLQHLSLIARSAGWSDAYEYFAYPPVILYLYYPFAHLFGALHPTATYFFPVSGSTAMPSLPIDFYLFFKLPIWIADFLIGALLVRMSGSLRGWRDYLLNPYVLLVSAAWTFDALMVVALVLGVYWLQRGKLWQAGAALAVGTMIKFIPVIAVPVCIIFLIKRQRPLREIIIFTGAFALVSLILVMPFLQGTLLVVQFHGTRIGGGMNWQQIWMIWDLLPFSNAPLHPVQAAIGAFGTPTLIVALLIAYAYAAMSSFSLNRMLILTLLAFFLGSKLVNEQYALVIFPFLFLEARRIGGVWRIFHRLFWIVPLCFAIMRVPIDRFLWPLYHTIFGSRADLIASTGLTGFEGPFNPWRRATFAPVTIVVLGLIFYFLCVVVFLWPATHADSRVETRNGKGTLSGDVPKSNPRSRPKEYWMHSEKLHGRSRTWHLFDLRKLLVPTILFVGLLALAVFHFNSVLTAALAHDNQVQGITSCANGKLQLVFHRDDGTDRPELIYDGNTIMTYADWSSSITVDGTVEELWNHYHGYTVDPSQCTVYSTTTGAGWQLVEIVRLLDSHTAQVTYDFVARSSGGAPLHHVDLQIAHVAPVWSQPTVDDHDSQQFSAQVFPGTVGDLENQDPPNPAGTVTMRVSGSVAAHPLTVLDLHSRVLAASKSPITWATALVSHYMVDSPQVDRLTTIAREVVSFQPVNSPQNGIPASGPISLPMSSQELPGSTLP